MKALDASGKMLISVLCPPDQRLHLAPEEQGCGASVFTLCLERWTRREPCREDSELCTECVEKWKENQC
jgi:hypothetical protein